MSEERYEGIRHTSKTGRPTYVMVPRKLIITWFSTTLILFIMILFSFQYANYVDRRSNGLWCGVVNLFDDTYKESPPTTDAGKSLAAEFDRIRKGFKCK